MTKGRSLDHALNEYLPAGSAVPVLEWFNTHHVVLRVTGSRRSKLGDFRGSTPFSPPVISVNHNLNPYSFLVTLLHEMAHAEVFLNFRRRMQPHGEHWKQAYRALGQPYLHPGLLPDSIRTAFADYLRNPSASSTTNLKLALALRAFDAPNEAIRISELPADAIFALPDGRMFKRGDKLRKRYRCECLNNKRIYLFSPLAEIIPVEKKE